MHKCECGKEFEKLTSLHGHKGSCKRGITKSQMKEKKTKEYRELVTDLMESHKMTENDVVLKALRHLGIARNYKPSNPLKCARCRSGMIAKCPSCGKMTLDKVWYGWSCFKCGFNLFKGNPEMKD